MFYLKKTMKISFNKSIIYYLIKINIGVCIEINKQYNINLYYNIQLCPPRNKVDMGAEL